MINDCKLSHKIKCRSIFYAKANNREREGGCYYFTFMQEILENKLAALMFNVFVCILLIRAAVHQRAVTVYETYLLFAMNEEWFTNATLFKLFLFFNMLSRLLVIKIVSCLFIYGN